MAKIIYFSDVHGNLVALEACLLHMDNTYGPETRKYCLGDIVGYGAQPKECLDLVTARVIDFLLGNHEDILLRPEGLKYFNPAIATGQVDKRTNN
jgi:hypothetical protein